MRVTTSKAVIPKSLELVLAGRPKHPLTPFQVKVYSAACMIPAGSVVTYQQLARHIHCNSPRAIGQALKRNPHAPDVPCHRVVAVKSLGGFFGQRDGKEVQRKKQLLMDEGVQFDSEGRILTSCFYSFA